MHSQSPLGCGVRPPATCHPVPKSKGGMSLLTGVTLTVSALVLASSVAVAQTSTARQKSLTS